jgi:hypothetical protein
VFGQKKLEKRLESDSSDSEDEASKGKLKRQHPGEDVEQTGKATDLLVEVCCLLACLRWSLILPIKKSVTGGNLN